MAAGMMTVAAGDIAFYRGHGSLEDDVIELVTHGDLTHCEVVVAVDADGGTAESIGALAGGVTRHALPAGAILAPTAGTCSPDRLALALAWLRLQAGDHYGFAELAIDGIEELFKGEAPAVDVPRHFTCGHLAAAFLAVAGYPLPPEMLVRLETATPMALADALGVQG